MRDLRAMIDAYPEADEIVWVQEEPENMGAWEFVRPHLRKCPAAGRPARRAPAQREPGRRIGRAARASISRRSSTRRSRSAAPVARASASRLVRQSS